MKNGDKIMVNGEVGRVISAFTTCEGVKGYNVVVEDPRPWLKRVKCYFVPAHGIVTKTK